MVTKPYSLRYFVRLLIQLGIAFALYLYTVQALRSHGWEAEVIDFLGRFATFWIVDVFVAKLLWWCFPINTGGYE